MCFGRWKTTFGERQLLVEDDLQWKTNFIGRWPSMEDDFWLKAIIDGRRPSFKDDLHWETIFGGRPPSVEDNLWLKTTFVGRQPLVEDDLGPNIDPYTELNILIPILIPIPILPIQEPKLTLLIRCVLMISKLAYNITRSSPKPWWSLTLKTQIFLSKEDTNIPISARRKREWDLSNYLL